MTMRLSWMGHLGFVAQRRNAGILRCAQNENSSATADSFGMTNKDSEC